MVKEVENLELLPVERKNGVVVRIKKGEKTYN